jgi:hypothetical protein
MIYINKLYTEEKKSLLNILDLTSLEVVKKKNMKTYKS